MNDNVLSRKLKQLRISNNLNQTDVAQALGIGTTTYANYENGVRTPDITTVYKLAGIFKVSVEDLMHVFIGLDRNIDFDAPIPTDSSTELNAFIEYMEKPNNKNKLKRLSSYEKQLIYYFEKLSNDDKEEILEITKLKYRRSK